MSYTCTKFRNFSSYDFLGKYTYFDETEVAKIWLAAVNDLNSPTNPLVISTYYKILRHLVRNQHIFTHTNESLTPFSS